MAPRAPAIAPVPMAARGPAPSAVNMQQANTPQTVPLQSQNRAACGQAAAGTVPVPAAAAGGTRFLFFSAGPVVAPAAAPMLRPMMAPVQAVGVSPTAMASEACVVGASSTPEADNQTGTYVAAAIGGLIGLITIAAIIQKYKTMGSYSSFWGRMIGLADGAAAFGIGYQDYAAHSANECDNLFGDPFFSSPCPCLACCYILFAFGVFQLGFNLPFLYASEKAISSMYAKMGLMTQAGIMVAVSGAAAAGIKFSAGSMTGVMISAVGCLVGVMFLLGWFKGEDGILGRMFQSAKDMINGATEAAAAMVDDGLKVFGLNADERSKVTVSNVYSFCRVVRGPDWSAGDEDGGPDGPGGEVIGYVGENGVAEGVAVTAAASGWAKVKWDPRVPGQVGKTGEYRIGAGNKFELKMVEETEGIVDKLMGQTFAMFGIDPNKDKKPAGEKKQIEFILTSRRPGEEPDAEVDLKDDSDDEGGSGNKKNEEKLIKAAMEQKAESLVMACDVYDAFGKQQGRCDDTKQMLYKSAIRHRALGGKQDAIVVELQKLPAEATLLVLSVKIPEGKKLGNWDALNIRATATGHDLSRLSVTAQEGSQGIQKHMGSQGYVWFVLYSPEPGKWYAEKSSTSLGTGGAEAMGGLVSKFLAAREPKKPSKKKKGSVEAPAVPTKDVTGLTSVEEIFENLKIELKCEQQAREMMNAKLTAVTTAYTTRLKAQGVPAPTAALQGKKMALLQINKQHQALFQKTLIVRRVMYIKQRIHPVAALVLAKKDANRAALYDGKEAEIRQAVMNTMAEEKAAQEELRRSQEEQSASTYTGQASALAGSLWGWAGSAAGDDDGAKKKKKKKKKSEEAEPLIPEVAAPAAPPPLPPQFANMTPQQLAAIRAMQQKQMAAKAAAAAAASK